MDPFLDYCMSCKKGSIRSEFRINAPLADVFNRKLRKTERIGIHNSSFSICIPIGKICYMQSMQMERAPVYESNLYS